MKYIHIFTCILEINCLRILNLIHQYPFIFDQLSSNRFSSLGLYLLIRRKYYNSKPPCIVDTRACHTRAWEVRPTYYGCTDHRSVIPFHAESCGELRSVISRIYQYHFLDRKSINRGGGSQSVEYPLHNTKPHVRVEQIILILYVS